MHYWSFWENPSEDAFNSGELKVKSFGAKAHVHSTRCSTVSSSPSQGSFRGALSPGPQKGSATSPRKRGAENAVVHFFRTIVSKVIQTRGRAWESELCSYPRSSPLLSLLAALVSPLSLLETSKCQTSFLAVINSSSGVPRPSQVEGESALCCFCSLTHEMEK